ncbi:hypothetical protein [Leptospira noguchii]
MKSNGKNRFLVPDPGSILIVMDLSFISLRSVCNFLRKKIGASICGLEWSPIEVGTEIRKYSLLEV